jgi:hypothetical protein
MPYTKNYKYIYQVNTDTEPAGIAYCTQKFYNMTNV